MVEIVHYEVYANSGSGWNLMKRFYVAQREDAFAYARELEGEKYSVRINKEIFNVKDNTVQDIIEYARNYHEDKNSKLVQPNSVQEAVIVAEHSIEEPVFNVKIMAALGKIFLIMVFCLVFSNILVKVLLPLIQLVVAEELIKIIYFVLFISFFLLLALPLIIHHVPWYVFVENNKKIRKNIPEKKLYQKATQVMQRYDLNGEYIHPIAPAYPKAALQYKKDMIIYLKQLLSNLGSNLSLEDSFSRLGLKLIVYGGCLELCSNYGLKITEANSLLLEAFNLIDGQDSSLEDFYDAKKTYRDTKVAVFLTGVGAYLMSQEINRLPWNSNILNVGFQKWKSLNYKMQQGVVTNSAAILQQVDRAVAESPFSMAPIDASRDNEYLVCISCPIKFMESYSDSEEKIIKADFRNIIANAVSKFNSSSVVEISSITSVGFASVADAEKFAITVMNDALMYRDNMQTTNAVIEPKMCIVKSMAQNEENINGFIRDILMHTYAEEILLTSEVKANFALTANIEELGSKYLEKTGKQVELYKLKI